MRISKLLLIAGTAAVCAGFISARADDNPAQAAARAALMEKMNDLDASTTATNAVAAEAAPIMVTTNGAAMEPTESPMTNSAPMAEPMPKTIPAAINDAETATEPMPNSMPPAEAMPEIAPAITNVPEVPSEPTMTMPMPETAPETSSMPNAPEVAPEPAMTNSMPEPVTEMIPASTNAATATGSPVLHVQPDAVGAAQPEQKPVKVNSSEPAKVPMPMKNPVFQPIEAPPLPISAAKQAQLDALLQKYKADQVTPSQYQIERAKILAEP